MKIIRQGIFETNSSSTHSMIIMSEEDYTKWMSNQACFDNESESLVSFEKRNDMVAENILYDMYIRTDVVEPVTIDMINERLDAEYMFDYPFSNEQFDNYLENRYLDVDYNSYKTKHNELLKIICFYGRD